MSHVQNYGGGGRRTSHRYQLLSILVSMPEASQGEQHKLIGKLATIPIDVVEEDLMQVAHVCITHSNAATLHELRGFLMWLVSRSFSVALRVSWVIESIPGVLQLLCMDHLQKDIGDSIESVAVNRSYPFETRPDWIPNGLLKGDDDASSGTESVSSQNAHDSSAARSNPEQQAAMTSKVVRKVMRLRIFTDVRGFVQQMTSMSNQLRFFQDRSQRKHELRTQLHQINASMSSLRLVYPLDGNDKPVRWIVRIPVEECTVFSSRERAPFLLRCEVIVDDTATMNDPTRSTLRNADGRFRMSKTSDELLDAEAAPAGTNGAAAANNGKAETSSGTSILEMAFGETAEARRARLRQQSPYGRHPRWDLLSVIVKAGDDIRQEELALQLIGVFNAIWMDAGLTCLIHPYGALSVNADSGVIECVNDANSLDGIKKACQVPSLNQFFARAYGGETSKAYIAAQRNFIESMAGYSVLCYILQVKDRHNGNLMITRDGHLVHIDFGFLFVTSPGGINFESAPFKLSQELLETMGGVNSTTFDYFKVLVYQAMVAIRERADEVLALISLMTPYNTMPCFGNDPVGAVQQVRWRLRFDLEAGADFAVYVRDLILNSVDNWRTRRYDQFQTIQNGIL